MDSDIGIDHKGNADMSDTDRGSDSDPEKISSCAVRLELSMSWHFAVSN